MRTSFDLTPFYRSSVGFDRLFSLLDEASRLTSTSAAGPAYNIERLGTDTYRITLAVPGFEMDELEIVQQPNLLIVSGKAGTNDKGEYLHRAIEHQRFTQRFELADFVDVTGAALRNGLLTIELKRNLPDTMKPRRIEIASASAPAQDEQKQIEAKAA